MWENCLKDKCIMGTIGRERKWSRSEGAKISLLKNKPFLTDYFNIANSKAFRRIRNCTQVFTGPVNPFVRTRETHIMEVAVLAETMALYLGLNSDLTRAIALSHDMGHVPFAHVGEEFLRKKAGSGFSHAVFSAIIARDVERKGRGLNLCYETLEGAINHSGGSFLKIYPDEPEEYVVIRIADKVSYIFSDLNDARRHGYLDQKTLPKSLKDFGFNQRSAVNHCLKAIYKESAEKGVVSFVDSLVAQSFREIRDWMFDEVYYRANKLSPDDVLLEEVFECLAKIFPEHDPIMFFALMAQEEIETLINHLRILKNIGQDEFVKIYSYFSIIEILPYIKGKKLDYNNYQLPKLKFNILE